MKKRILIVDDDHNNCEIFSSILKVSGYETEMAHDGVEALQKLDEYHYDLVISDIFMPKLNGIELLKKIKEAAMNVKVIMITGQSNKGLREESLKGGAITFLEKPIEANVLLEAVKNCFIDHGFDGNISEISLFDLIQFLALAKKNRVLDIKFGEHHGQIYFNEGEIVHAVTKTQSGEEAFYECLGWKSGFFKDFEYRKPKRISIIKPVELLLMDAAKIMDETSRLQEQPSPVAAPKPNQNTRLRPMLLKVAEIEGISGVAWLDKKGAFLMGEGSDFDLLKSIPRFILSTEARLKGFHSFPELDRFCLRSSDGRKIFTMRLNQLILTVLLDVGFEPEPIHDIIFSQLKIKKNGDA